MFGASSELASVMEFGFKQSFWDKPGILSSRAIVEASISDPRQMARFLAAVAAHSGDWLLALPVSSCGLRLADDAVRVAVALRLDIVVWR